MSRKMLPSYVANRIRERERERNRNLTSKEERNIRDRFANSERFVRDGMREGKTFDQIVDEADEAWHPHPDDMSSGDYAVTEYGDEDDETRINEQIQRLMTGQRALGLRVPVPGEDREEVIDREELQIFRPLQDMEEFDPTVPQTGEHLLHHATLPLVEPTERQVLGNQQAHARP